MLGPSSQASSTFAERTPSGVDAVHLGGRELRQLAELLVRHEALEPLAAKPRCKSVEPRPLGLGEESARDVDPHVRPARNRKGSSGVAGARAQACPKSRPGRGGASSGLNFRDARARQASFPNSMSFSAGGGVR